MGLSTSLLLAAHVSQDLSVAGKRVGLDGSRSGLFYQAIRIIKEMRNASGYPRYAVAENVPGIFSSGNGEDFRIVLEEMCRVKDEKISIPKAKWLNAESIVGDDFSLAWRVLDAQYFSVPQRRQRVFLVADFDGQRAEEILFEPEVLSRNSPSSRSTEQTVAGSPEESSGETGHCIGFDRTNNFAFGIGKEAFASGEKANFSFSISEETAATLQASGPGAVFDVRFTSEGTKNVRNNCYETDTCRALTTQSNSPDSNQGGLAICMTTGEFLSPTEEKANPLMARDYKDPQIVSTNYTVRRLTPTECARLQGFPDTWCDNLAIPDPSPEELAFWKSVWKEWDTINGKKIKTENQIRKWLANPTTDAKMYKLWGNGVALPCVYYILSRISSS